jgi:hypothetical protein
MRDRDSFIIVKKIDRDGTLADKTTVIDTKGG